MTTIHVLRHGRVFCDLAGSVPADWPEGHAWVSGVDFAKATCGECRARFALFIIVNDLGRFTFRFGDEATLQRGIAGALEQGRIAADREVELGPAGRIDFLARFPTDTGDVKVGIEVKCDGSISALVRQLQRYADHPDVNALAVVISRSRLGNLPHALCGKPLAVVSLQRSAL